MKAHTRGKRSNEEQIERRVDYVEELLGERKKRCEIHKLACKKFKVDWRTVERYVSRARERLLLRLNASKNEHRSKALAFYEHLLTIGNTREKILAQERIDKLLGLEAPRIFGHGGAEGLPPIKTDSTVKTDRPFKGVSKDDLKKAIAEADARKKKK